MFDVILKGVLLVTVGVGVAVAVGYAFNAWKNMKLLPGSTLIAETNGFREFCLKRYVFLTHTLQEPLTEWLGGLLKLKIRMEPNKQLKRKKFR